MHNRTTVSRERIAMLALRFQETLFCSLSARKTGPKVTFALIHNKFQERFQKPSAFSQLSVEANYHVTQNNPRNAKKGVFFRVDAVTSGTLRERKEGPQVAGDANPVHKPSHVTPVVV